MMKIECKYVTENYQVPACIGRLVVVNGVPGIIAADYGHHIGVLFDHDKPGNVYPCHPTWRVEYGGIGTPRKLTKKKQQARERYQRYLEYGDGFNSFRDYLAWDVCPDRSWNGGK